MDFGSIHMKHSQWGIFSNMLQSKILMYTKNCIKGTGSDYGSMIFNDKLEVNHPAF